jgi:hypothetical protein
MAETKSMTRSSRNTRNSKPDYGNGKDEPTKMIVDSRKFGTNKKGCRANIFMSNLAPKRKPGTAPKTARESLKKRLERHLEKVGRGAVAGMKAIDIEHLLDEMLVQYPRWEDRECDRLHERRAPVRSGSRKGGSGQLTIDESCLRLLAKMPSAFATRKLLRLLDEQFDFKKSGCKKARQFFLRFYAIGAMCLIHFDTAKFFKREITPRGFIYKTPHGIGFFKKRSTSQSNLVLNVNTPLGGSLLTDKVAAGAVCNGSAPEARFYHQVPAAKCYELTVGIDWEVHNGPKLQSVRDRQATEGDKKNVRAPHSLLNDLAKAITHSEDNPFTRSAAVLGGSSKSAKKLAAQKKSAQLKRVAVLRSGGEQPDREFVSVVEAARWCVKENKRRQQGLRVGCQKAGQRGGSVVLKNCSDTISKCITGHRSQSQGFQWCRA